jgi:hypothetical protein
MRIIVISMIKSKQKYAQQDFYFGTQSVNYFHKFAMKSVEPSAAKFLNERT